MKQERWLRIIPVALIMYTISYVDRTNVSLALDPRISGMMSDLLMDDRLKGEAAGIFFLGYVLLQIPGGWLASHWSARKLISLLLLVMTVLWFYFTLAENLTVLENVVLGLEPGQGPILSYGEARRRIRQLSDTYGMALDPDELVEDLTVGERQRVDGAEPAVGLQHAGVDVAGIAVPISGSFFSP